MKTILTTLIALIYSVAFGQEIINLSNNQIYLTNNALIYDQGGANGIVNDDTLQAVIKSQSGFIELFFTYIEIAEDAELRIYNGTDTSELIGLFNGHLKPQNMFGKAFTILYIPGSGNQLMRGWEGRINSIPLNPNEKVTLPESDCIGAIPLCSNSTVNTSANQYEDTGLIDDDDGSCYSGTGSGGSVWYSFSPQSNGNIDFMINPTGTTDYDFVLWDITNGCENRTQISCNFSGTTGATGLNSSGVTNSQDASGTTNNQLESVVTTGVYAICINYYSGTNGGFNLNFQNVAGTVAVVDNTAPYVINAYSSNCTSTTSFTVNFSEYIDCNTLQSSDFSLPGYTITLITTNCVGGKTDQVIVSVSPALPPGNYSMTVNNMTDMCGNPMNSIYPINTTVIPVANAGPDAVACSTPGLFGSTNYGSATLTGSGGTSYQWSTGQTSAGITVSPSSTTTYTLTAIQGSCASTDQVVVTVSPAPSVNLGPNQTICSGFPVTLTASGGTSYQWQSTTTTNFFGNPTGWTNIAGATSPSYTGTPGSTIFYQVIVTNAAGCQGIDNIKITIGAGAFGITAPPFICQGASATLSLPGSMTLYTWSVGGAPIGTANTALVVSPASTTTYTATSTTPGCSGSANVTVPVHAVLPLSTSANPDNACAGIPVNLTSTAPSNLTTTITENFEAGAQTFTLINGSYNNWYHGTAAFAGGSKGLYIGTAITNNDYVVVSGFSSRAATNHAFKNYTVTSYCSANLSFNWKCGGNSNAALTVWIIPTTVTPVAGTALTASSTQILAGGPYFGTSGSYTNVSLDLTAYAGQTIRVVFSWKNTGGLLAPAPVPPAASIDDIIFTETTTYNYSWSSNPSGFSASTANATDTPTSATIYDLTVTRCDGCPVTSSVNVLDCTVLPIELDQFDGKVIQNINRLHWSTVSENNNDYFTLERSSDGVIWEKIAEIDGSGNSTEYLNYFFEDHFYQKNTINYYRLFQTDFDGTERESGIIVSLDNRFTNKTIISKVNLLGQVIPSNQKGLCIYIYDDGTSEKIYEE